MNLDQLTMDLEKLESDFGALQNEYDRQIADLQDKKTIALQAIKQEIDAGRTLQLQLLGDAKFIETDSFIVSKKYPNPKSKATYKLVQPTEKNEKEKFLRYMQEEHIGLLKEETTFKLIANDTKQLLVDGVFHITGEGLVVDDNGMAIPYLKAEMKDVEVKVKVKNK
ncbi:hypothetical protein [Enterococcus sp. JM9B]|uniref:hypothetical protein n=1 Tax=Enterococcus sp. JM9B TaxID=1857216 RepID=UPI001374E699|nr:hypothetical protein [Enterococcus sp. JM9B]KAF1303699.1 hypothetical protein BAU16_03800 [Enterococcus sp. JM9B]